MSERLPTGWRLIAIPDEPTERMIDAGREHNHRHNAEANMIDSFKAMIAEAEIEAFDLTGGARAALEQTQ